MVEGRAFLRLVANRLPLGHGPIGKVTLVQRPRGSYAARQAERLASEPPAVATSRQVASPPIADVQRVQVSQEKCDDCHRYNVVCFFCMKRIEAACTAADCNTNS